MNLERRRGIEPRVHAWTAVQQPIPRRIWSGLRESNPYPLLGRQVPRLSAKPAKLAPTERQGVAIVNRLEPDYKSGGDALHRGVRFASRSIGIIAALSISACSSPAVRVQYIETKTYIPIPTTLTQPISVDLTGATWGKAVSDLKAGLQTCDGQLQAIKDLKVPPKTP